jgi:cytochrome c556
MILTFVRVVALGCLTFATIALAHEGATGVVKERMDLMKSQQDAMKLIGEMAKGKTPFDAAKASEAAREIETTAKNIPKLFPEGSDGGQSEALPAIWGQWDRFSGDADDLAEVAGALASSFDGTISDDWKAEFKRVTNACKSCHQDFRKKKKKGGKHH